MLVWWTQSKSVREKVLPASDNHDSVFLTESVYNIFFLDVQIKEKEESKRRFIELYYVCTFNMMTCIFYKGKWSRRLKVPHYYCCLYIYMDIFFTEGKKSAVEEEGFKEKMDIMKNVPKPLERI